MNQQGEYDETWAYDYNTDTRTKMKTSKKPTVRFNFGMTYGSIIGYIYLEVCLKKEIP